MDDEPQKIEVTKTTEEPSRPIERVPVKLCPPPVSIGANETTHHPGRRLVESNRRALGCLTLP